ISFLLTSSIVENKMLVRFVFSLDKSGGGDELNDGKFIIFACGRSELSSVAYPFGRVILDSKICRLFKVSCLPSIELMLFELMLFEWLM
ncbi:hypothetical protein EJB05_15871, partial [Eragrostis curvula]